MNKDFSKLFANTVWACQPDALEAFYSELDAYLQAGVKGDRSKEETKSYAAIDADGTLQVNISGMMLSSVPSWFAYYDIDATGTHALTKELASYRNDPTVKAVQLNINSPGGDVTGVQSLADLVKNFGKPTVAKVNGMAASAAYWVASSADEIVASDVNDMVGSIGVFTRVVDNSRLAKNLGTEFHVIRSGPNKGVGQPGIPVTADNISVLQERVNATADTFKSTVALGRNLDDTQLATVTDGRAFTASQGLSNGLVDRIESMASEVASRMEPKLTNPLAEKEGNNMANEFDAKAAIEALNAKLAAFEKTNSELVAKNAALESEAKAKAVKLEAELALKQVALAQVEATVKLAKVDAAVKAGKVLPAMRGMFEALADKFSAEELDAHLAALPVLIHSNQTGSNPKHEAAGKVEAELTAEDTKVMKMFGLTEKQYKAAGNVVSFNLVDAEANLRDGTTAKLKEIM